MDGGYSRVDQLVGLREQGWSGVVIKAVKVRSHAMVTDAVARALGYRTAILDLTTVGKALEHSISLAVAVQVSWPPVENNSRQFAP